MNFKNVSVKLLAVVMTVAMMLGVCAPTVIAAVPHAHDHSEEVKPNINYVSLGDSMTNGYGLDGYNHNSGVADYGDGAYPNQFAAWLDGLEGVETVNHAQLAMSGIRTEDIHWLLELDYNNQEVIDVINEFVTENNKDEEVWDQEKWNEYFSCGDYWTLNEIVNHSRINATFAHIAGMTNYEAYTGCTDHKKLVEFPETVEYKGTNYQSYTMAEKIAVIAKYYQENVAAADIISLSVGNGNIGVFGFGRILETIGFADTDTYLNYNYEDLLRECEPELKAEVVAMVEQIKVELAAYAPSEDLANVALYIAVSLVLNYAGTLDAILQSNPDVEIVLVPVMNTFGSDNAEVEGITLGDLMGTVIDPINAFIAALPTVMQVAQNEVYADATFYMANPGQVGCMVDEYVYPLNGTIRDRFVESIVGYCDCGNDCSDVTTCGDYSTGMIWGMLGSMVVPVTAQEIADYEAPVDDAARLAYAATEAKKASSIAIYLAFEKAIVEGKDAPVTLDSIFGLGGSLSFDSVLADFAGKAEVLAAGKLDVVAGFIAANSGGMLDADQVKSLYAGGDVAIYTFVATGSGGLLDADEVKALYEGDFSDDAIYAVVAGKSGGTLNAAEVKYIYDNTLNADVVNGVNAIKAAAGTLKDGVDGIKAKTTDLEDGVDTLKGAVSSVSLLCTLLATPDALSAAVQNPENGMSGLLALFARCVIGNGLGAHPSQAGHDELAKAVIAAYENGHTAQDETIENLKVLLGLLSEYYDEAYAYAYDEAEKAGVIAQINAYLDEATAAIDNAEATLNEYRDFARSEEFVAEADATFEQARKTIRSLKALIVNADELDAEAYEAFIS